MHQNGAVCSNNKEYSPDTWFGDSLLVPIAKKLCFTCPVQAECLEYAVTRNIDEGVWGGMTPEERRAYRRKTRRAVSDPAFKEMSA